MDILGPPEGGHYFDLTVRLKPDTTVMRYQSG
jgi:hypothetical protein